MLRLLEGRSPTVITLIGLGSAYFVYFLVQYAITIHRRSLIIRKNGCKPPPKYPHSEPFFGIDLFIENAKLSMKGGFLERLVERYQNINGGVWTYSVLLNGERAINTAEPENIKAVLATKFKDFELPPRRKAAFHPIFGHGIFSTDGKEWEASRALLRPNFARSQVGDLDTFETHISKLIARIPRDGSTVDLQPLFFMLTLDSATEFLFGSSTDTLGNDGTSHEMGVKFAEAFTYATEIAGLETRVGKLAVLMPDKRYTDSVNFIHTYVRGYVQKAVDLHKSGKTLEKADGEKYVFLEELAKTGYGEKKIQDELLNILLAGRDTTASLLSYLFWHLARNPEVFNKLRVEIMQLGDNRPSFEQIKAMKYLQYTLNEGKSFHQAHNQLQANTS
jgi:cytochrome P450